MEETSTATIDCMENARIKTEPLDIEVDNEDEDDDETTDRNKNLSLAPDDESKDDNEDYEEEGAKIKKSQRISTRQSKSSSSSPRKKEKYLKPPSSESTFCPLCQKSFKNTSYLKRHHEAVHINAPVECEQCGKPFKNTVLLKVHYRRTHSVDPAIQQERLLKDKLRKQAMRAKAKAIACGLPLPLPTPNNQQQQQHDDEDEETACDSVVIKQERPTCDICNNDKTFSTFKSLAQHKKTIHNQADPPECSKCGKTFKNHGTLRKHQLYSQCSSTNNNNNEEGQGAGQGSTGGEVECDVCSKKCKNGAAWKKHFLRYHRVSPDVKNSSGPKIKTEPSTKPNPSAAAAQPMSHSAQLYKALVQAHSAVPFPQCQICHKEFANIRCLKDHLKHVHTSIERMICSQCGKMYSNSYNLKVHLRRAHGVKVRPDQPQQSLPPAEQERLRKQREQRQASRLRAKAKAAAAAAKEAEFYGSTEATPGHLNRRKYIPCIICRDKFSSRPELKTHELAVHGANNTCLVCNKVLPSLVRLKIHVSQAHNQLARTRPVVCDHCGNVYRSKYAHDAHMRRVRAMQNNNGLPVLPSKLLSCPTCKMEFTNSSHLKIHARRHEPDNGIRYPCDFCSFQGRWKESLTSHIHRIHNPQAELDEPFLCPTCGKSFKYQQDCNRHVKIHDKDTVFTCLFCDKEFTNNLHRRQHERLMHPSPEGYSCLECEYSNTKEGEGSDNKAVIFKSPALLERHTKLHHPHLLKNRLEIIRKPKNIQNISVQQQPIVQQFDSKNSSGGVDALAVVAAAAADPRNLFGSGSTTTDVLGQVPTNSIIINAEYHNKFIEEVINPLIGNWTDAIGGNANAANNVFEDFVTEANANANDDGDDWFGGGFDDDADGFDEASGFSPPTAAPEDFCQVKLDIDREADDNDYGVLSQKQAPRRHLQLHIPLNPDIDTAKYSTDPKLAKSVPVVVTSKYIPIPNRTGRLYCGICALNFSTRKFLAFHMKTFHGIDNYTAVSIRQLKKRPRGGKRGIDQSESEDEAGSTSEDTDTDAGSKRRTMTRKAVGKRKSARLRRRQTKRRKYKIEDEDEEESAVEEGGGKGQEEEEAENVQEGSTEPKKKKSKKTTVEEPDDKGEVSTDSSSESEEEEVVKATIDELQENLKTLKKYKKELADKKKKKATKTKVSPKNKQSSDSESGDEDDDGSKSKEKKSDKNKKKKSVAEDFSASSPSSEEIESESDYEPSQDDPKSKKKTKFTSGNSKKVIPGLTHPCTNCSKSFKSKGLLKNHFDRMHVKATNLQCPHCHKPFDYYGNLTRHIALNHVYAPVSCRICKRVHPNVLRHRGHKRQFHSGKTFQCRSCERNFTSSQLLGQHVRNVHKKLNIMCAICPYIAPSKPAFARHMGTVHKDLSSAGAGAGEELCPCPTCGKTSKDKYAFERHLRSHSTVQKYKCLFCSASFNTSVKKRKHEAYFHDRDKELMNCRVCQKSCRNSAKLEQHFLDKHSKAELNQLYYEPASSIPRRLPVKRNQFATSTLEPHELLFKEGDEATVGTNSTAWTNPNTKRGRGHGIPDEQRLRQNRAKYNFKPVKCTVCRVLCKNKACMSKHINMTHPEHLKRNCELCGAEFPNSKHLSKHKVKDHGLKQDPITCNVCNESFTSSMKYYKHYSSHGVPVPCEICGKEFKRNRLARAHMRAIHGHARERKGTERRRKERKQRTHDGVGGLGGGGEELLVLQQQQQQQAQQHHHLQQQQHRHGGGFRSSHNYGLGLN